MKFFDSTARVVQDKTKHIYAVEQEFSHTINHVNPTKFDKFKIEKLNITNEFALHLVYMILTFLNIPIYDPTVNIIGLKIRAGVLRTLEASFFIRPKERCRRTVETALSYLEKRKLIIRHASRKNRTVIEFTPQLLELKIQPKLMLVENPAKNEKNTAKLEKNPTSEHICLRVQSDHTHNKLERSTKLNTKLKHIDLTQANARAPMPDDNSIKKQTIKPPKSKPDTRTEAIKKSSQKNRSELRSYSQMLKSEKSHDGKPQMHTVLWSVKNIAETHTNLGSKFITAITFRGWLEIYFPELLFSSGTDWATSGKKWNEMSGSKKNGFPERDFEALNVILPALSATTKDLNEPNEFDTFISQTVDNEQHLEKNTVLDDDMIKEAKKQAQDGLEHVMSMKKDELIDHQTAVEMLSAQENLLFLRVQAWLKNGDITLKEYFDCINSIKDVFSKEMAVK